MATETKIARVAFMDRGVYSGVTEYSKWDFVTTEDSTYLYIGETPAIGKPVTDTAYWKCIADGKQATLAAAAAAQAAGTANDAASLADQARLAIETELGEKAAHGYDVEETPKTLKEVDTLATQNAEDISQLAGDVSLLDAVQGAKIKDIENVISTMNPNQSAQLSVSGVSPLSLPKNAANSGMIVKMEGLTQDVGGVITNFEPTGRVRSVGRNLIDGEKFADLIIKSVNSPSIAYKTVIDGKRVLALKGNSTLLSAVVPFTLLRATGYTLSANTRRNSASPGGNIVFVYDDGTRSSSLYPVSNTFQVNLLASDSLKSITGIGFSYSTAGEISYFEIDSFQIEEGSTATTYEPYKDTNLYLTAPELRSNGTVKDEIRKGANGYEMVKRISEIDGTVLTTPVITPISYGGILNSAENGTVYHEPVIADAGVYGTNMPILLTDYPIASIEEIIKHENGIDTYLNVATAVIASDGLSFTHPDLVDGDLVLFTYAFDKESTNGNITATFYDSNVVKIDTVTGKAYRINEVVTNGVLTRTLTEV